MYGDEPKDRCGWIDHLARGHKPSGMSRSSAVPVDNRASKPSMAVDMMRGDKNGAGGSQVSSRIGSSALCFQSMAYSTIGQVCQTRRIFAKLWRLEVRRRSPRRTPHQQRSVYMKCAYEHDSYRNPPLINKEQNLCSTKAFAWECVELRQ